MTAPGRACGDYTRRCGQEPTDWLRAGEALSAVWLRAIELGAR